MLVRLEVTNLALIEHAVFEPGDGLVALTGETGAGKTALLSAVKLCMGARADSAMVRDGAARASVKAAFASGDETIEVERIVSVDGRSSCRLDGATVTVGELASRIGPLVDLVGQHEQQVLLSRDSHAHFLDAWIGEDAAHAKGAYIAAFDDYAAASHELDVLERASRAGAEALDAARFALSEIEGVAPVEGEYEELSAQVPVLQNVDALAAAALGAYETLKGEGAVGDLLATPVAELRKQEGCDLALDALASRLDALAIDAEDLAGEFRSYRQSIDFDPASLARKLDRLAALDGLIHRYGPRMEDVFSRAEEARAVIDAQDNGDERLAAARERIEHCEEVLTRAAAELIGLREDKADAFSDALTKAVSELAMEGSSFSAALVELPRPAWTREGPQTVELLYSPGGTASPKPLVKIASGGELSRVLLALKCTLDSGVDTFIFDEVDAGIGGAVAVKVAEHLSRLSASHQVIVVTHLATIAAAATRQFVVEKHDTGAVPATVIRSVFDETRIEEIARMLSGEVNETTLAHARALLG